MQEPYQNPADQAYFQPAPNEKVMTVGQWLVTMLLMILPIVNLILLIMWAVSDTENRNRSNWAKAYLIMLGIGLCFSLLYLVLLFQVISAAGGWSSITD